MLYAIRHTTRFEYSEPVSESLMEIRMHPRSEGPQRCHSFQLSVMPRARAHAYRDYLGNVVHHFGVPGKHSELRILTKSLVELAPVAEPADCLSPDSWSELDSLVAGGDYWEMLTPSHFVQPSEGLTALTETLDVSRRNDPLTFLRQLNSAIYNWFDYVPQSTRVDSPIDHAIEARKGVCQDFAHVMIALARHVKIPCRYVSGYLYHCTVSHDRSADGATHAWVEALVPRLGWIGFDPTNDLMAGERHIRTAVGRDYNDVPPTKGVYRGDAASRLSVNVRISLSESPVDEADLIAQSGEWQSPPIRVDDFEQQQMQQ